MALQGSSAALESERARVAEQQDRLLDLYLQSKEDSADGDPARYRKKAAALADQERALVAAIEAKRAQQEAAAAQTLPVDEIKATCALLAQSIDRLTFEEKRLVLGKLLTRVVALPPTPEAPRGRVAIEGVLPALSGETPIDGDGGIAVTTLACHPAVHARRPRATAGSARPWPSPATPVPGAT